MTVSAIAFIGEKRSRSLSDNLSKSAKLKWQQLYKLLSDRGSDESYTLMEVQPREIQNYLREDGTSPFEEWLESLRDRQAISLIDKRLKRVKLGNLGDYRSVGEGVFELKIDCGPGYRIYFGQIEAIIVLLLCGGDKSTQNRDIRQAIEYWKDYERSEKADK